MVCLWNPLLHHIFLDSQTEKSVCAEDSLVGTLQEVSEAAVSEILVETRGSTSLGSVGFRNCSALRWGSKRFSQTLLQLAFPDLSCPEGENFLVSGPFGLVSCTKALIWYIQHDLQEMPLKVSKKRAFWRFYTILCAQLWLFLIGVASFWLPYHCCQGSFDEVGNFCC